MNSQEFRALQESYSQVYELDESVIGDRARNAVADQRLDAAQRDTQSVVDKLGKMPKVTRASAQIAAKRVEADVRNTSAYGPQRPKPGTTGAYRITDSFDLYNIILSHLLDEGYADTNEAAITIMANMSEDWRDSIVEGAPAADEAARRARQMDAVGAAAGKNPKAFADAARNEAAARARRRRKHLENVDRNNP